MERPSRYKATGAYQHRVPLQETPSRGNSGPSAAQMTKPIRQSNHQPSINDENVAPNSDRAHTNINSMNQRQQDLDKRVLNAHPLGYHNFVNGLRPRKTHIGPWQLGVTVGQGGSCTVRLVRHVKTGETAVAKIIHKSTAEKVRARSLVDLMLRVERGDQRLGGKFPIPIALEREIVIMRLLKHPNIVQIYDVWENQDEIYLVMENVDGGELFQYLTTRGALQEEEAVYIFRQLVEALAYCHKMCIFHRDLKPENILLDKRTFTVKLIDFGMAAYQPMGNKLKTPCGSPHYAAPELLQGLAYDGGKADVWSLGVVLYLMLVGDLPFNFRHDDPENQKLRNLYNLILAVDIKIPNKLSFEAQNLLRRVFVSDPKRRLDIFELWHQPLLHKYDRKYGLEGRTLDTWTRNMSSQDEWQPLRVDTIDKGLFRNLLTLWHDVKEDVMIKQLCSDE
jgi:serine/threonine-protein kinase HSL1 (negative regulator of Swe1 kinase)